MALRGLDLSGLEDIPLIPLSPVAQPYRERHPSDRRHRTNEDGADEITEQFRQRREEDALLNQLIGGGDQPVQPREDLPDEKKLAGLLKKANFKGPPAAANAELAVVPDRLVGTPPASENTELPVFPDLFGDAPFFDVDQRPLSPPLDIAIPDVGEEQIATDEEEVNEEDDSQDEDDDSEDDDDDSEDDGDDSDGESDDGKSLADQIFDYLESKRVIDKKLLHRMPTDPFASNNARWFSSTSGDKLQLNDHSSDAKFPKIKFGVRIVNHRDEHSGHFNKGDPKPFVQQALMLFTNRNSQIPTWFIRWSDLPRHVRFWIDEAWENYDDAKCKRYAVVDRAYKKFFGPNSMRVKKRANRRARENNENRARKQDGRHSQHGGKGIQFCDDEDIDSLPRRPYHEGYKPMHREVSDIRLWKQRLRNAKSQTAKQVIVKELEYSKTAKEVNDLKDRRDYWKDKIDERSGLASRQQIRRWQNRLEEAIRDLNNANRRLSELTSYEQQVASPVFTRSESPFVGDEERSFGRLTPVYQPVESDWLFQPQEDIQSVHQPLVLEESREERKEEKKEESPQAQPEKGTRQAPVSRRPTTRSVTAAQEREVPVSTARRPTTRSVSAAQEREAPVSTARRPTTRSVTAAQQPQEAPAPPSKTTKKKGSKQSKKTPALPGSTGGRVTRAATAREREAQKQKDAALARIEHERESGKRITRSVTSKAMADAGAGKQSGMAAVLARHAALMRTKQTPR